MIMVIMLMVFTICCDCMKCFIDVKVASFVTWLVILINFFRRKEFMLNLSIIAEKFCSCVAVGIYFI